MSPNRGNRCFFNMKRRCFCVECLYMGNTDACHSPANVRNVMRETQDQDLRSRARDVLRELKKTPFKGPRVPMH